MSTRTPPIDAQVKIYMVGDSSVGKTCMMLRFARGQFTTEYMSTIGVDFKVRNMQIDDQFIRVQVWDTAGQERFRTIATSYFRGAQGILLVYDITNIRSFNSVADWMVEVRNNAPENVVVALVGNKIDREEERVVPCEKGRALAQHYGIPFYETSAKTSSNLEEIFSSVAREVLKQPWMVYVDSHSNRVALKKDDGSSRPRRPCC